MERSQVVVLQACLINFLWEYLFAVVENGIAVVSFICCRVVTSDDWAHILHVRLQAMGIVQGVMFNSFRRWCDEVGR